jgi:putative transposase
MSTYALTTGTHGRRAISTKTANAELLLEVLFRYRDHGRYRLHGFAVMLEHLRVLLTPASGQTIERCAQCIKGGFSHDVRKQFGGEIWQPGFHEHRVRDAADFISQPGYIAANPGKRDFVVYAYAHTCFLDRIDPMPDEFRAI